MPLSHPPSPRPLPPSYPLSSCYLQGVALVKIGREEPVASMDTSGKIIWARHNEVGGLGGFGGAGGWVGGEGEGVMSRFHGYQVLCHMGQA